MERYDIRITNPPYPDPFLGRDPLAFASTAPANITILANDFTNPFSHQSNLGVYAAARRQPRGAHRRRLHEVHGRSPDAKHQPGRPAVQHPAAARVGRIDEESSTSSREVPGTVHAAQPELRRPVSVPRVLLAREGGRQRAGHADREPGERVDDVGPGKRRSPAQLRRQRRGDAALRHPARRRMVAAIRLPFSATAGPTSTRRVRHRFVPGTSRNQGNRGLDLSVVNAYRATRGLLPVTEDDIDSTHFSSVDLRASKIIGLGGRQRMEMRRAAVQHVEHRESVERGFQGNASATTFGKASRAQAGRQAELAVRFLW